MQSYDEAIAFLGEWGPYQRTIFLFLSLTVVPNGYTALSMVFLADIPQHHCRLPNSSNVTIGETSFLNLSLLLPVEEVGDGQMYSKCTRYKTQMKDSLNDTMPEIEPCIDGWVYNTDRYTSTIVTEWDLVCDNGWKGPFTTSVFFLGILCGSIISGQLSDRYGRKVVLFGGIALQTILNLIQLTSQSWEMFCVLYFFVGVGDTANYVAAFVLGMELLGKSERIAYTALGMCTFYAFGYMLLPLCAYYIRDWRMLLLTLTLPEILYVPLWLYIPESPRWLLTQSRVEQAEAILKDAARKNGITHPGVIFDATDSSMDPLDRNRHEHNYLDLIITADIRNVTILSFFLWMTGTIGYYGLSLNTPNMRGDPYINCFISAASELLVYVIVWWLMQTSPRRITTACMFILSGGVLLLVQFVPSTLQIVITLLLIIGKSGATAVYTIIYIFTSELYPTVVRNMGLGACSMASRVGSIISPYFAYLVTYSEILAFVLMGSLMVTAGLLSLLLPETRDQPLPETIQQMQPMSCCYGSVKGHCCKISSFQTTAQQTSQSQGDITSSDISTAGL
ncbi:organic cation/carnitine transporter 2-like [Stegostoma tigrinum]|uniref:organic cation/carnitine transporter 2-like n=1 Tax=Stegostoma tigrinum TaxID=3053191 RepID=UPI00287076D0|nr:organic cation/carnitine transporter 2-like [Stegostoma tigrinum]XP_048382132.2 organic cation/carnitine transporter 2-like [Stegostoma tigrinum]XP_048382147.2 organic cation/carnitine transporter 2-like [Stegostoma tigrinum]